MSFSYHENRERQPRLDRKPGWMEVVPIQHVFVGEDGKEVRIDAAKMFDSRGNLVRIYCRTQ